MDFQAVSALVIFCLVVAGVVGLVLFPVTLTFGTSSLDAPAASGCTCRRRWSVSISYCWVPVLGVLAMLATRAANAATLARGIIGDETMAPFGIVFIFISLAYISTSLDMTGLFASTALHITRLSKGNGMALFLLYYCLSSVMTVFTSNDVCIMTLTPIIHCFSAATGADSLPFLAAAFTAANTWSMLLFVGNPTNIIVATAYGMTFVGYSRWMALPTLAAGAATLGVLLALHRRSIPTRLALPELQPAVALVDRPGAIFGSINMLACLGLLAAGPALGWQLWLVTLVCAGLHACYNLLAYVLLRGRWCSRQLELPPAATPAAGALLQDAAAGEAAAAGAGGKDLARVAAAAADVELAHQQQQQQQHVDRQEQQQQATCRGSPALHEAEQRQQQQAAAGRLQLGANSRTQLLGGRLHCSSSAADDAAVSIHSSAGSSHKAAGRDGGVVSSLASDGPAADPAAAAGGATKPPVAAAAAAAPPGQQQELLQLLHVQQPSFWRVLRLLPWEVVPFVLGMFVLVQGLVENGWVDRFAAWLGAAAGGGIFSAAFAVGGVSVLLANLANNQPMTIVMTRVCLSPAFAAAAAAAAAGRGGGSDAPSTPSSGHSPVPVASAFAVVVASNVAANYSVMGALAGIMFINILAARGVRSLGYVSFSRLMLPAGVSATLLALVVLGAEFATWPL